MYKRQVPSVACPNLYIRIFMSPTETILAMAPAIIRAYAISFLLLPFNIFSTYYFQAILQPKAAFIVSVARGLVISGALILMLPLLAGADSLWYAHHGACHRRLRCGVHPQIHRAARRKSHLTKRGHRRIIMAEF